MSNDTVDVPEHIGNYQVLRRLGAGHHGEVYYAWDLELLRPVVLKVLKDKGENARERLLREARLSSAVEHPNVCSIHGVGEDQGRSFIVMQFVPGRPLSELLRDGPLSLPLTLSIGQQIADGLAAAHAHGVVHRDLKPSNLMITEGGLVKILDFGLAVRRDSPSSSEESASLPAGDASGPLGTTGYIAPEQFVGLPSSEQTDVFALGVVLYYMSTGLHPFVFPGSQQEVARHIQFTQPMPPREKRDMPEELDRLIRRALEKAPADRYDSATALGDALRSVIRQQGLGATSTPSRPLASPDLQSKSSGKRGAFVRAMAELVHRRQPSRAEAPNIAVLPFIDSRAAASDVNLGFALSDALAAKLSRLPGLTVRPSGSLLAHSKLPADPVEAGKSLAVSHVLSGSLAALGEQLVLSWQLLELKGSRVLRGDTIQMPTLDLVAMQKSIGEQVVASLRGASEFAAPSTDDAIELPGSLTEDYLSARATLWSFMLRTRRRSELEEALSLLRSIRDQAPHHPGTLSALAIAELHCARNGYGDTSNLHAARDAFEAALALDPHNVEAKVHRVYTLVALGEKESARHALLHLLETTTGRFDVHITAATLLRLDGAQSEALEQLSQALRNDPNHAHVVHLHRARILHYQGKLEDARVAVERGLQLAPKHPLLRTTQAYLHLRNDEASIALPLLQDLLKEDPSLRLTQPTLALAYQLVGNDRAASELITAPLLAAAECDPDTAYRVATYYATAGQADQALHWLRRSIYLGNENHSWLAGNPMWTSLRADPRFQAVLDTLRVHSKRHLRWWQRVL